MRISPNYCLALLTSMTLGATLMIGCAASEDHTTGMGGTVGSGGTIGSGGTVGSGGSGSGGMGSGGMTTGSGGAPVDMAPQMEVKPEAAPEVQAETAPDTAGGGVTFTALYADIFGTAAAVASSCAGGDCHNPGTKDNVNLSTKMQAFTTLRTKLTVGNPGNSTLIRRLESNSVTMRMPLNKPALSTAQIARVRAWIMAGAMDN